MGDLTHFNEQGRAKMVDVTAKPETSRTAIAQSSILLNDEIYELVTNQKMKKGDVLAVAQVAGIMASKNTSEIIPMCHPIALQGVNIAFSNGKKKMKDIGLGLKQKLKTKGSTGVEMEALTAASVTALTIYDMCKALDKGMVIGPTFLVEKTGGVSSNDYKSKNSNR